MLSDQHMVHISDSTFLRIQKLRDSAALRCRCSDHKAIRVDHHVARTRHDALHGANSIIRVDKALCLI